MSSARVYLWAMAAALVAGCCGPGRRQQQTGYEGPTLPMARVIEQVNANNSAIPTLVSRLEDVTIQGKEINGSVDNGWLIYRRPREIRLTGSSVAGEIFRLGSNGEIFYLIVRPPNDKSTAWWGRYSRLGPKAAQLMPMQPDLVLEVLGIGMFNTDLTVPPVPIMRFDTREDVYSVIWATPANLPNRWIAQKEIWYDRQTLRPRVVMLYDVDGRVVLRAELLEHFQLEVPGRPKAGWPYLAKEYRLHFPQTQTNLSLTLDRGDTSLKQGNAPNDQAFAFEERMLGDVDKVIQVDE